MNFFSRSAVAETGQDLLACLQMATCIVAVVEQESVPPRMVLFVRSIPQLVERFSQTAVNPYLRVGRAIRAVDGILPITDIPFRTSG